MKFFLPLMIFALACSIAQAADAPKPNIVFILADDFGIDDASTYGSDKHKTPNIDKLAETGLKFQTCYAAPLCGPSRCLLMTGRYAFHTGGLGNGSWAPGGIGAVSANERPMAAALKNAGYVTGMAGKWRQVGETPADWGFDEYMSDPAGSGYYWNTRVFMNRKTVEMPPGSYNPDDIQKFTIGFIDKHKDDRFFFYYAPHFVHEPTLHTPTSPPQDGPERYDDNISYLDNQIGQIVAELDRLHLREKTLIMFSGDNGTAKPYHASVNGKMIDGFKGTMLEGGARVPLIANWTGVTPVGKVSQDLISFADPLPTFVDLAGGKLPTDFKYDGQSFASQLQGQKGTPRSYAFVQLMRFWYVREPGFKMDEKGNLYDMSDAPYAQKEVTPSADTPESKAARQRLSATLAQLSPATGKVQPPGTIRPNRGGAEKVDEKSETVHDPNDP